MKTQTGQFAPPRRSPHFYRDPECLVAAAEIPGWTELLDSAPILAFAIANCWRFDGKPVEGSLRRMRRYVAQPRDTAWKALGFDGSGRIVEKLAPNSCTVVRLKFLRATLPSGRHLMKALSHENTLRTPLLNLLMFKESVAVARPKWISYFNRLDGPMATREHIRIFQFFPFCNVVRAPDRYPEFDAWLTRKGIVRDPEILGACAADSKAYPECYPSPPIPCTDHIQPITSMTGAELEGRDMHHCMAELKSRPHLGGIYYYRMLAPERATIEITWHAANAKWEISQLRTHNNAEVESTSAIAAEQWLGKQ
jgi:hypothetical protein